MDVQPIVVPVKLLRVPTQQVLLIATDAIEQGSHVISAKHVSVLDSERPEDLKRFRRFVRDLLDAIHRGLHPIDYIDNASPTPAWPRSIEQRRRPLRRGVEHRYGKLFKSRGRNGTRLHARHQLVEQFESRVFL